MKGMRVVEEIRDAHPLHKKYPLLPGDLLVDEGTGTWTKEAPGVCVSGFVLTGEQIASLAPVDFECRGLAYSVTAIHPDIAS